MIITRRRASIHSEKHESRKSVPGLRAGKKQESIIRINQKKCGRCGFCYDVCPDFVIGLQTGASGVDTVISHPELCCRCGHCVSLCPRGALELDGMPLNAIKRVREPGVEPDQLKSLIATRRSIRRYERRPVSRDILEYLLEAASHSGSGSNLQTVEFIAITRKELIQSLELRTIDLLWNGGLRFAGGNGLIPKLLHAVFGNTLAHQLQKYHGVIKERRAHDELEGMVFRNAPVILLAHDLKKNNLGPYNSAIALRSIELLAHSMKLGTCWAGLFLTAAQKRQRIINNLIGLGKDRMIFGAMMLGYPEYRWLVELPRNRKELKIV